LEVVVAELGQMILIQADQEAEQVNHLQEQLVLLVKEMQEAQVQVDLLAAAAVAQAVPVLLQMVVLQAALAVQVELGMV
jgi:ABC-type glycerol-3-phosphate transport system permease component